MIESVAIDSYFFFRQRGVSTDSPRVSQKRVSKNRPSVRVVKLCFPLPVFSNFPNLSNPPLLIKMLPPFIFNFPRKGSTLAIKVSGSYKTVNTEISRKIFTGFQKLGNYLIGSSDAVSKEMEIS